MTRSYTDWLKRPESERNAEAEEIVMGNKLPVHLCGDNPPDGYPECLESDPSRHHECDQLASGRTWDTCTCRVSGPARPFCTDRNDADLLLAEVERRGRKSAFTDILLASWDGLDLNWMVFSALRAPASLLAWAAIEACRGGEA